MGPIILCYEQILHRFALNCIPKRNASYPRITIIYTAINYDIFDVINYNRHLILIIYARNQRSTRSVWDSHECKQQHLDSSSVGME